MEKTYGVLLAAGKSSRMPFYKLTELIGGRPMVRYALDNLRAAGINKVIAVIGHNRERVKEALGGSGVEWVIQEEQLGTGHAAAQAIPALNLAETVVVLFGDCPFLEREVIKGAISTHHDTKAGITLATVQISNPRKLGQVSRDQMGYVQKITDFRDIEGTHSKAEVFVGLSVWKADVFRSTLQRLPKRQCDHLYEFNLPDAVEVYVREGGVVSTYSDVSENDAIAPNESSEFDMAADYLRSKVRTRLREHDVQMLDPQKVIVDYDVKVGERTIIYPNTILLGSTIIGSDCEIGPDTTLRDCIVGNKSIVGKGSWTKASFSPETRASDRLALNQRHFKKAHYMIPEKPNSCFVIMPFHGSFFDRLENIIRPTLRHRNIDCHTADVNRPGIITDDIWEGINGSSIILADISEDNLNVWYELGIAHALNKQTIILCEKSRLERKLPFDIHHFRVLEYELAKGNLATLLSKWLDNLLTPLM